MRNADVHVASETMDILMEISKILGADLSEETLNVCLQLCELGVNPDALATVIQEMKTQTAALLEQEANNS